MGIIQQASGTSTGSGNFTVTLPAASSAANLVVVSIVSDSVIATPSGWTLRATQLNNVGHYMWDRAGGASSYTFNLATAGQITWQITEVRGGVFDKAVSANNVANATSYAAPAITPAAGQKILLISFGAQKYFGNVPSAFTYSGTPTTDSFQTFAVTDNTTQGAAHLDIASATGSTAYNYTATNGASSTPIASWSAIVGSYTTTTSSGNTYTATPTDSVGATDAVSVSGSRSLTFTDPVGITDLGANQTIDYGTTPSDAVGLTDSALLAVGGVRGSADPAAVTDTATTIIVAARTATDTATVTDSAAVTVFSGYTTNPADGATISDTVITVTDTQRSATDTLGLTDSTNILATTAGSVSYNDPVNITDGTTTALSGARTAGDSINVTDTATAVLTIAGGVVAGDQAGVTDAISIVMSRVVTVADFLALTDTSTAVDPGNQHDITITAALAPQRWHATLPDNTKTATLTDRRYGAHLA